MFFKNINLDTYNKRLLAILGTVVGFGIIIIILILIAGTTYELVRNINHDKKKSNHGIIVNQNKVIDTTTHSVHQELSILEPYQLDTISPVFIVPIGQKNQTSKNIKIQQAGLAFGSGSYSKNYEYSNFNGLYNNFVLIDYTKNFQKELFSKKVALTEWAYLKIDETKLIVVKGTDSDTNEDGILNKNDFQSLFVFNLDNLELKTLKFKNQTVRSFEPLKMTTKIYVRTGKDLNNDKSFKSYKEPTDLYFYDVTTGEYETLIPKNVKEKIQGILNK